MSSSGPSADWISLRSRSAWTRTASSSFSASALRSRDEPLLVVSGLSGDRPGRRLLLGAAPIVGPLLGDERLLTARELDPVVQLVLGDRPLLLDRECPPGEGRLVGLLLNRLARRLLERLLDVALRGERGHPDGHDRQPEFGEPGLGRRARG